MLQPDRRDKYLEFGRQEDHTLNVSFNWQLLPLIFIVGPNYLSIESSQCEENRKNIKFIKLAKLGQKSSQILN